jgi:VanZ family protein
LFSLSDMPPRNLRLRNLILVVYAVMVALGSLYPFAGWHGTSGPPAAFLFDSLPRYITRNDIITNLLLYLPLGYLLMLVLTRPARRGSAILLAWATGSLLSLGMETLQAHMVSRIASNLDVYLNSLGTLTGALLALHHGRWLRGWRNLHQWRLRWFRPHGEATIGLWLLLLWGITQFALLPQPGVGWLDLHLRPIDALPDPFQQLNWPWFFAMFLEVAAVGAFAACLLRPGRYASAVFLLFVSAFALKLLVAAMLLKLSVLGGILSLETLSAFILALWLLLLPSVSRHRETVAIALLGVIVVGRLLFLPAPLWPSGSLLNLVGMARHLAALWPWLALAWLVFRKIRATRI